MGKTSRIITVLALAGTLAVGVAAAPAGKKSTRVTVGDNFFDPGSKTIRKGTLVKFKWTGGGPPHNVTKTRGPAGKIASKTTSRGGVQFRKRFKQRGKYKLICTIHPDQMKLTLKVR